MPIPTCCIGAGDLHPAKIDWAAMYYLCANKANQYIHLWCVTAVPDGNNRLQPMLPGVAGANNLDYVTSLLFRL